MHNYDFEVNEETDQNLEPEQLKKIAQDLISKQSKLISKQFSQYCFEEIFKKIDLNNSQTISPIELFHYLKM